VRTGLREPLTIILTGAGAPGVRGTLFSLRRNPDQHQVRIVGVDTNARAVGRHLVDSFQVVPAPEQASYVKALQEIAEKVDADVILPQTTREVAVLSRHKKELIRLGVPVAVGDEEAVQNGNNKWAVAQACEAAGLPAPRAELAITRKEFLAAVEALGYPASPVVAKLPSSNGMRGVRVIRQQGWDMRRFVEEKPSGLEIDLETFTEMVSKGADVWPTLLVTEYLPGSEYSVDVFRGAGGAKAVARLRQVIRSGITFDAQVLPGSQLEGMSIKLAEQLDMTYAFGFQWKEDASGAPRILECNPRVQGTMVVSTLAGVNVVWLAIREALGAIPTESQLDAMVPMAIEFQRFWGGVVMDDGSPLEI
jgi:carbamoyl-phosphate synthase large subunit